VYRLTLKYKTQTELEAREDQDGFLIIRLDHFSFIPQNTNN
jgi:hypothetical protein